MSLDYVELKVMLDRDEAAALYGLLLKHDASSLGFAGSYEAASDLNRALDTLRFELGASSRKREAR